MFTPKLREKCQCVCHLSLYDTHPAGELFQQFYMYMSKKHAYSQLRCKYVWLLITDNLVCTLDIKIMPSTTASPTSALCCVK